MFAEFSAADNMPMTLSLQTPLADLFRRSWPVAEGTSRHSLVSAAVEDDEVTLGPVQMPTFLFWDTPHE
jgi:hypothetical protein